MTETWPETEAEFQLQVLALAHATGWRAMHVRKSIGRRSGGRAWQTTTSVKGWPDLFLWHPRRGEVLAAELKSDDGRLTVEQQEVIQELNSCGIDARCWRPRDWAEVESTLTGRRPR